MTNITTRILHSSFNNLFALMEGWDLFDVDGRLQLQRIDSPSDHGDVLPYMTPIFSSDADAMIHVAQLAQAGSFYHRDALHRIGTPAEGYVA